MGTDIHIAVQAHLDGAWTDITEQALPLKAKVNKIWNKDPEYAHFSQEEKQEIMRQYFIHSPEGRNYTLFALLANVRNGYGFAGCEIFNPIKHFELKGVPEELEDEVDNEGYYNGGYHSYNHFTYQELVKSKLWNQKITVKGFVKLNSFLEFIQAAKTDENATPSNYCGDVSGPNVVKLSGAKLRLLEAKGELDAWLEQNVDLHTQSVYVKHSWEERTALKDSAFYSWLTSDEMEKLVYEDCGGPDDVRLIVSFDS